MPILLKGEAPGVKVQGGILEQLLREVEIECLPADIPGHIDADVSQLVFGQVIRVSDLPHDGKVKFITDENQPVAHVVAVKEVVEAAPAEAAVGRCGCSCRARGHQEGQAGNRGRSCRGGEKKPEKAEKSEKKK